MNNLVNRAFVGVNSRSGARMLVLVRPPFGMAVIEGRESMRTMSTATKLSQKTEVASRDAMAEKKEEMDLGNFTEEEHSEYYSGFIPLRANMPDYLVMPDSAAEKELLLEKIMQCKKEYSMRHNIPGPQ